MTMHVWNDNLMELFHIGDPHDMHPRPTAPDAPPHHRTTAPPPDGPWDGEPNELPPPPPDFEEGW